MTDVFGPINNSGRHIVVASSRADRDRLISDYFNHFEIVEKGEDVDVLQRRPVSFKEKRNQERLAFDRSWKGRLEFLLGLLISPMSSGWPAEKPKATSGECMAMAALPPGTEVIEIHLLGNNNQQPRH
jgi:hypothetical protein